MIESAPTDGTQSYLGKLYARTMRNAYAFARQQAALTLEGDVLDCGSGAGTEWAATFNRRPGIRYRGLEWSPSEAQRGRESGLDIVEFDLNQHWPADLQGQDLVIAYSVLEHLLRPCRFLAECHRALRPGGRLILLTPNISTYFTIWQLLCGRMPSSGPHPDSDELLAAGIKAVYTTTEREDVSAETPQHRHLVVFSMKVLKHYLGMLGFTVDAVRGFGWYPAPHFAQSFFEHLDSGHCHQMVIACRKV